MTAYMYICTLLFEVCCDISWPEIPTGPAVRDY